MSELKSLRLNDVSNAQPPVFKITALRLQAGGQNRVNVSINGKYRFSLDVFQISELGLKVGREYSAQGLAELEEASQFGKLYARALEYCLVRPRSLKELRSYLWRKTRPVKKRNSQTGQVTEKPAYQTVLMGQVLERLIAKNYLNDEKFARWWLENRRQRQGVSLKKLRLELRQKGISPDLINEALAASDRQDAIELQKVIKQKASKYDDPQKLMVYLVRQGFSYDDVKQAMQNLNEEDNF